MAIVVFCSEHCSRSPTLDYSDLGRLLFMLQVYDAAACLAKYLDSDHFQAEHCSRREQNVCDDLQQPLSGRRVVELGAGTGVVGIMASYLGASTVITDLDSLVPLVAHNITQNSELFSAGTVTAKPLCWGSEPDNDLLQPDFLILANCVYYESSLETLLETVLTLTSAGRSGTVVLACYEERTKEISQLVCRWHSMLSEYFAIYDVDRNALDAKYLQDYVRVVRMLCRCRQ